MSYVVEPALAGRRRRWPWLVLVALAVVLLVVVAFVLGRSTPSSGSAGPPPASATPAPPASTPGPAGLHWTTVAGSPVPSSPQHGPREVTPAGVARGYTHDKAGAVLAAINITARMTPAAGASTARAVIRQQTYGNPTVALRQLRQSTATTAPSSTRVQQWWYAITAGDPQGSLVQVSLLIKTQQARDMGGYARLTRTLSWRGGDWKLQLPAPQVELIPSTAGYTLVGGRPR